MTHQSGSIVQAPVDWQAHLDRLAAARAAALTAAQTHREKSHARGRLLCRERLDLLLDPGSFHETGLLAGSVDPAVDAPADGLVCGTGTIDGRRVCVAADDGSVVGGSRGLHAERKLRRLRLQAVDDGCPFIWLQEGSGGRIQEQMGATFAGAFAEPFLDQTRMMASEIPTVAALLGNCFGQPAFVAALADFVVMTPTAFAGVSGPPIVAAATGEVVSAEELGGVRIHAETTGLVHWKANDEIAAMDAIRRYLSYFPSTRHERPPVRRNAVAGGDQESLLRIVPADLRSAYDMRSVLSVVVDKDSLFEAKPEFGRGVITAYARIEGMPVAVVASQPLYAGGALEPEAADKIAAFVKVADSFNVPLVFLQDVPGFLVGSDVERAGQVTRATHVLAVLAKSTVPKFTVIMRKAYGLAYMVLCGYPMGPTSIVGWPTASISQMGPGPGVNVIHYREIASSSDPDATRSELGRRFEELIDPYIAARHAYLDDIIDPRCTRSHLAGELARTYAGEFILRRKRPCW